MSSEVQIFENGNFGKVRVVMREGEPWFVAKDIATILGYADATHATRLLEEYEKGLHIVETLGGKQELTIISESGVYQLIFQSRKPEAKAFSKWVRTEVLPSIRKTGSYNTEKTQSQSSQLANLLEGAKVIFASAGIIGNQQTLALDKLYHRHAGYSALETANIKLIAPEAEQMLTPTEIGKYFVRPSDGKFYSGLQVNKLLQEHGLQKSVSGKWEPTQNGLELGAIMLDTGKIHSNGVPVRQLKWSSRILDFCAQFWIKAA